jgi:hypothetical protein
MKAMTKKRLLQILLAVAGILTIAWVAIPHPIEGYWITDAFTYLDGEHQFLRFSEGHVYFYDPWVAPKYFGTYRKIGWNTYIWGEDAVSRFPGKKVTPDIVRVGWFRCSLPYSAPGSPRGCPKMYRDWRVFDISRVMRLSEEQAQTNRSSDLPSVGAAGNRSP